tara:strand:+ start:363 stop:632 length:270 start_codon:yes stop_codon:yes gene_type:complete
MGKKSRRNRTTTKDERKANREKMVENVKKRCYAHGMDGWMKELLMEQKQRDGGGRDAWQRTLLNQMKENGQDTTLVRLCTAVPTHLRHR